MLSTGTNFLGVRIPKNKFVLDLAKLVNAPITATSAGISKEHGGFDAYSAKDVALQFAGKKHKPDLIIDAGKLKKTKPSTLVKIYEGKLEILRQGPVSNKDILSV